MAPFWQFAAASRANRVKRQPAMTGTHDLAPTTIRNLFAFTISLLGSKIERIAGQRELTCENTQGEAQIRGRNYRFGPGTRGPVTSRYLSSKKRARASRKTPILRLRYVMPEPTSARAN